jgi:hypothetical protein
MRECMEHACDACCGMFARSLLLLFLPTCLYPHCLYPSKSRAAAPLDPPITFTQTGPAWSFRIRSAGPALTWGLALTWSLALTLVLRSLAAYRAMQRTTAARSPLCTNVHSTHNPHAYAHSTKPCSTDVQLACAKRNWAADPGIPAAPRPRPSDAMKMTGRMARAVRERFSVRTRCAVRWSLGPRSRANPDKGCDLVDAKLGSIRARIALESPGSAERRRGTHAIRAGSGPNRRSARYT